MHSLGIALVVIAGLGWLLAGPAITRPRLRPGERRLMFDLRPLRLRDLTSLQKRKLIWLLVAVLALSYLGLFMAQGGFDQ